MLCVLGYNRDDFNFFLSIFFIHDTWFCVLNYFVLTLAHFKQEYYIYVKKELFSRKSGHAENGNKLNKVILKFVKEQILKQDSKGGSVEIFQRKIGPQVAGPEHFEV
jgi:hypothetical protein